MLNRVVGKSYRRLTLIPCFPFGLGNLLLHYIRTLMNRVRWEENRELRALETRSNNLPRSTEQANKLFVATEQSISLSEEARLQRIDQILGTRTHYQQVKPYQERLDSDHVMDLEELKKQHREEDRATLDWLNPKSDLRLRYKNKKKYYSFLSQLRIYPKHEAHNYSFADEKNENTIAFLGKQAVYSSIALKPVELAAQSLQGEPAGAAEKGWFESQHHVYFRPQGQMTLLRMPKALFAKHEAEASINKALLQGHAEEVVSLDWLYTTLKEYDLDERVSEYLKKVENGRVEYLFSFLSFDNSEGTIAVMLDLLGTKKEYCLLVKSLALPDARSRAIFNVRPEAVFSADGLHICYVQRSPQGGWIELVYRKVQSCWTNAGEVIVADEEEGEVMFRCEAEKQLRVGTDSNKNYIFLAIRNYQQEYSESLYLLESREKGMELIQLDKGEHCKYKFDVCSLGILFARFQCTDSYLKYGKNSHFANSVQLIPYKQHIQIHSQEKIGINDGLLPPSQRKNEIISPTEFDVSNKRTIFRAGQNEFIREMEVRQSHLITVLNLHSVYDRAVLSFVPFKPNAHPHSLLLGGGAQLNLRGHNYSFLSQQVQFSRPYGCLLTDKLYSIWKKELSELGEQRCRFHHEIITINEEEYPLEIGLLCRSLYAQEKQLPVVVYFAGREEELEGGPLRQLLEKGVMLVQFRGRGTFTKDLEHFLRGSRSNFPKMLDDLQVLIEFIGNNFTKNISLYCKGEVSSLAGLWFNIYFPYLFNATVLHNGIYDLADTPEINKLADFFGAEEGKISWDSFNIFKHPFKQPFAAPNLPSSPSGRTIGTLENIIVSSDKEHRVHSRKLVHRLRSNESIRYEEVYLKQYDSEFEADIFNLSYLYAKIRTRMEEDRNSPQEEEEEPTGHKAEEEKKEK